MIALPMKERVDFARFATECETVRRECPQLMSLLEQSIQRTTATVFATDGFAHYREVGALRDLTELANVILTPPKAPVGEDGMG